MNDSLSRKFLLLEAEHTEMFDERDKETMLEMIRSCPSYVKHGEWIGDDDNIYNICFLCDEESFFETNFCPNCGADMRERKEQNGNN